VYGNSNARNACQIVFQSTNQSVSQSINQLSTGLRFTCLKAGLKPLYDKINTIVAQLHRDNRW